MGGGQGGWVPPQRQESDLSSNRGNPPMNQGYQQRPGGPGPMGGPYGGQQQ